MGGAALVLRHAVARQEKSSAGPRSMTVRRPSQVEALSLVSSTGTPSASNHTEPSWISYIMRRRIGPGQRTLMVRLVIALATAAARCSTFSRSLRACIHGTPGTASTSAPMASVRGDGSRERVGSTPRRSAAGGPAVEPALSCRQPGDRIDRQRSKMMELLRTPDERFADLPGWSYAPHYADVTADGLTARMAYVDEGPRDGAAGAAAARRALLVLPLPVDDPAAASPPGRRVIAPDLIGFGRSDKPAAREDYTYARHVDWLTDLVVDALDLTDVDLFGQDWGGLLGLRLAAEQQERFAARSSPPTPSCRPATGRWAPASRPGGRSRRRRPGVPGRADRRRRDQRALVAAEVAAYDAPFPDESYKAGARQFPMLVPDRRPTTRRCRPTAPRGRCSSAGTKPFVCAFGDSDPVTRGADAVLRRGSPARRPAARDARGRAHFSQEDAGPRLAEVIIAVG